MKEMLSELRSAALATLVLAAACCGIYPLIVFGLAQALFPGKANGSLLVDAGGNVRGSHLIGQPFNDERHFHSRPSAAGCGYDATSSGGRNLGPTSEKLRDSITQDLAACRAENSLAANALVPADAVTASASGLDPHISPRNAEMQAARVAKARGLAVARVLDVVRQHTDPPDLGCLGEPRVNVLEVNLALEGLH